MCSLNEVPCQRPAVPMPLNVLPSSLPTVELVAQLALSSSDQLYPPAGLASRSVGQSGSPPARQLLGESPELLS